MSKSERNEMKVLAVVVGLLCLSLYYNTATKPETINVKSPVRSQSPVLHKTIPLQSVSQVDELPSLPLLEREVPPFTQSKRNVFEFSGGGEEQYADEDMTPMPDLPAPAQAEPEPAAPGSEITFVGLYVEKNVPNSRLAILSVNKKIVVVKPGDFIAGGYRVLKIEDDAVTLTVLGQKLVLRFSLGQSGVPIASGTGG